jgi:hypothetical protein
MNNQYLNFYKRNYDKLQSIIANIGGAANAIMTLTSIITSYITEKMLHISLSKYIVSFGEDECDKKTNGVSKINKPPSSHKLPTKLNKMDMVNYKKFENIRCTDVVFKKCLNKQSLIHIQNKFEFIYRKKMSVDFLMRFHAEFEKLKYLLFDENEIVLFENMKNHHFKTVIRNLEKRKTIDLGDIQNKKDIKNVINKVNPQDRISRNLLKSYQKP